MRGPARFPMHVARAAKRKYRRLDQQSRRGYQYAPVRKPIPPATNKDLLITLVIAVVFIALLVSVANIGSV